MNIYDINIKTPDDTEISMSEYKNKVLLIVNTATGCGFTPQYEGLQELYDKYKDKGFEILDFPCNQFGHQAPGTDEQISEFCKINYSTTFPRFKKIMVNGERTAPLYRFLKAKRPGLLGKEIKWNFTKFLVSRNGTVVKRYASNTEPQKIDAAVADLLG